MPSLYYQAFNNSDINGLAVRMKTELVPGRGELRGISGIEVDLDGDTYSIESRQSSAEKYEVKMDGITQDLNFKNDKIRIHRATSLFVVVEAFGATILLGPYRVYIVLHQFYRSKVCCFSL